MASGNSTSSFPNTIFINDSSPPATTTFNNEQLKSKFKFTILDDINRKKDVNFRPMSIIDDPSLREICTHFYNLGAKNANRNMDIETLFQSRQTISRSIIDQAHHYRVELTELIKESIQNKSLTISPDMWSDRYRQISYLDLIPSKDLTVHENISLKSNRTNNTEPVRRSLTLANTSLPKSLTLHNNDRSLTGISTMRTSSTIHECDEEIVGNNSDDDEDEDRLSNFIRQGLIVTIFSSSCSTIRTTTVTSLTSTISLPVSSKYK
ncbi:unnamed protein product [Rotaria sordida]|uniref:Uncharacterized protein n=1 Tax=Rotaria sordida TaxID=392033 RepID=A0A815AWE8_9BILA|nr:unnamed protein product [Rotaria sordida]